MSKLYNILDNLADRAINNRDDIEDLYDKKADKAVLSFFDRRMRYIYEHAEKQFFDIEDDTTEAYSKTLPSGVMGVGVNMIGAKSRITKNLIHFNDFQGTSSTRQINIENESVKVEALTDYYTPYVIGSTYTGYECELEPGTYIASVNVLPQNTFLHTSLFAIVLSDNSLHQVGVPFTINSKESVIDIRTIRDLDYRLGDIIHFNIQIEKGSTATPYESYFEGIKSADCDAVVSQGKNLIGDLSSDKLVLESYCNLSKSGSKYTFTSTGSYGRRVYRFTGFIPGQTYVFSATVAKTATSGTLSWIALGNSESIDNTYRIVIGNEVQTEQRKSVEFAPTGTDLYILFYATAGTGSNDVITVEDMQFEQGSTATPYSPYGIKGQMLIPDRLREEHPLRSAGSVHDEYNFNGKYTVVKIVPYQFTGNENWKANASGAKWYIVVPDSYGVSTVSESKIICAGFSEGLWQHQYSGTICLGNGIQSVIGLDHDDFSDANAVKEYMTGRIAYCELATPIYYYDPTSPELAVNGGTVVPDATHIVDEESYFPTTSNLLEAEAGGSVTFHQDGDTEFPVPNSTTYLVNTDAAAQS